VLPLRIGHRRRVPIETETPHFIVSPVAGAAGCVAFVLRRIIDIKRPGSVPGAIEKQRNLICAPDIAAPEVIFARLVISSVVDPAVDAVAAVVDLHYVIVIEGFSSPGSVCAAASIGIRCLGAAGTQHAVSMLVL